MSIDGACVEHEEVQVETADVLWNIDKLTVSSVIVEVLILAVVILQTFFVV